MTDARRIVKFRDEWAVCEVATVQEPPGPYDLPDDPIEHYQAWVFGRERAVLCRVGQEEASYLLPSWEPMFSSFFGDRFPFAIDSRSDFSGVVEKVGGANDAVAALAAFEVFVKQGSYSATITLRHGARMIKQAKGLQDFSKG